MTSDASPIGPVLDRVASRRLVRAAVTQVKAKARSIEAVTADLVRIEPELIGRVVDHGARVYFEIAADDADAAVRLMALGEFKPASVFARCDLEAKERVRLLSAHARLELAVTRLAAVVDRIRARNPQLLSLGALRRL